MKKNLRLAELLREIERETSRCARCGACQSVCPVFLHSGCENAVARGKIALAAAFVQDRLGPTPLLDKIAQNCLLCLSCQENCPNSVQVEEIIRKWRAALSLTRGLDVEKKLLFHNILRKPESTRRALKFDGIISSKALDHIIPEESGLRRRYPFSLFFEKRVIADSVPLRKRVSSFIPAPSDHGRVLFFTGCAIQYLRPEIGISVVNLLNKLRYSVLIPVEQECCGYVASASGDEETSEIMKNRAKEMLAGYEYDFVVTGCPTCNRQLRDLSEKDAEGKPIIDVSRLFLEYTEQEVFPLGSYPLYPQKVTYHDSCHLARGLGVTSEPRAVLKNLFGHGFIEMKNPDRCCGMGGLYGITHPELSLSIGEEKVAAIVETGAEYVITGCPACVLQLESVIREKSLQTRVLHLAQLIDLM